MAVLLSGIGGFYRLAVKKAAQQFAVFTDEL